MKVRVNYRNTIDELDYVEAHVPEPATDAACESMIQRLRKNVWDWGYIVVGLPEYLPEDDPETNRGEDNVND